MAIVARTNYASLPLGGGLDPLWQAHGKHVGTGASIDIVNDPLSGGFKVQGHTLVDGAVLYGGERCEVLNSDSISLPLNGGRIQVGMKLYLPPGFSASGSDWNSLCNFHYSGGVVQSPWVLSIKNQGDLHYRVLGGPLSGDGTIGTIRNEGVILNLSRGAWHTILADIKFHVTDGIFNLWVDGVQRMNLNAPTLSTYSGNDTYWKQGFYRSPSDSGTNSYYFQDTICWKNATPDEMLAYYAVDPPPPDPGGGGLAANTRQRRFGVTSAGAVLNGNSAGYKSGSKFATGLTGSEEADVKDVHVYCTPGDGTASTQSLTVGFYDDDGGGGEPGTKFGESQEVLIPGNTVSGWQKIILSSTIRVTGANCWILVGAGTPTNRVWYAGEVAAGGLRYGADTYDASPPRLSSPAGAMSSADILRSLAADYDVVTVTPPPSPGDSTAPAVVSLTANAASIVISYDEPLLSTSLPIGSDYAVIADGSPHTVSSVSISGSAVTLGLSASVAVGVSVSLSYTRAGGREVKDVAGNLASNLSSQVVTNETVPPSNPSRTLTLARTIDPASRIVGGTRNIDGLGGGV